MVEIEHITALIKQTEKEAGNIVKAMVRAGGIILNQLEEQSKEVEKQYQALITKRAEIEDEITTQKLIYQNVHNMLEFREIVSIIYKIRHLKIKGTGLNF